MLYFDHNATSPLIPAAREAWLDATERFIGNPSSPHRLGTRADAALTEAREKLAAWLGCAPGEIVWTSGATESNNAALHHAAFSSEGEAWISAIEHPCVMESARRHFGGRHRLIPVNADGVIALDWLANELPHKRPALIGVMAANNETGVLQPWREVRALCREHEVPFFCDAAQWIGKLPAAGLGACDFVSGCAHKFGGPQGVGFLKVPAKFRPLIVGGPQEESRRAGTENVAGVLAMIAALEQRESAAKWEGEPKWEGVAPAEPKLSPDAREPQKFHGSAGASAPRGSAGASPSHRLDLRVEFERRVLDSLPGSRILGANAARLWNTVSAVMPEVADCRQRWVVKLDKLGFAVSTGSACASGKEKPSHVLSAMNIPPDAAGRVLRFSSGWETRAEHWSELLAGLQRAFTELSAA